MADLGFTAVLPTDWIAHELPAEEVDVSNPTAFIPLAVVTAPHAALIFAFAARPAYEDGTLHDWAMYLLSHNQLQPRAIGRGVVAGVAAVVGEATLASELGPMVVRFAFLEDGHRLLNLTLSAPELLAGAVSDAWFGMLQSFQLETPRGSRFAIEDHPDHLVPPADPEPSAPSLAGPEQAPREDSASPAARPETAKPKTRFVDFALAADTTSLDPETAINASLRDRGIGLVPHVEAVDEDQRRATVTAGAILAQFAVPYGWHVIDDGRRTLVFEPSGKVQIHLNLIPREERSPDAILDAIEQQMRTDHPAPEFVRVREGRSHGLGARNIADGGQPIEQYHLLHPFRDDSMVLRARVTATPEEAIDACNLARLILASCVFAPSSHPDETGAGPAAAAASGPPAWWRRALELETQGHLEAAEQTIREACPHLGFAASTAEMYRHRMHRMKAAGDDAGACAAFKKASEFICFYASLATSGGEGTALSAERDAFRAQLVAEYGSDPEAV